VDLGFTSFFQKISGNDFGGKGWQCCFWIALFCFLLFDEKSVEN
jgi:hypothetical protein